MKGLIANNNPHKKHRCRTSIHEPHKANIDSPLHQNYYLQEASLEDIFVQDKRIFPSYSLQQYKYPLFQPQSID